MISATCTKRGTGISIWGDEDDLRLLYHLTHKLAGDSECTDHTQSGRIKILHNFAYEVRHAYQGHRLSRAVEITAGVHRTDMGFNYSWIAVLFTIACLRYNAAYTPTSEDDQDCLGNLENWVRKALYEFDVKGAKKIEPFVGPFRLNVDHDWVWQFYQQLEVDYMEMKVNKTRFRNINHLLYAADERSPAHLILKINIMELAAFLNCPVCEIEYLEYPDIKW